MSSTQNAVASSSTLPSEHKKRKHHSHSSEGGEKRSKHKHKSRHREENGDRSSSKHKHKQKEHKHRHREGRDKEKGKGILERSGPFEHRRSRMRLSVAPKYAGDFLVGVKEMLDGMLMRYVPQLGGVLLAHFDHELLEDTVNMINECPFGVCEVEFYSILWAPKVDQRLTAFHSISSPSHISLLFNKTFNVSIPLQHIPTEIYEFQHTSPEDDQDQSSDEDEVALQDDFNFNKGVTVQETGRWRRKSDGKLLGDGGEAIEFTVIGMEVTNQMLSLTGSLLADPHNPPPLPETHTIPYRSPSIETDIEMEVEPPAPKRSKHKKSNTEAIPISSDAQAESNPISGQRHEVIDETFLNARDLKKLRKEEERRKRDARKARKEEKVLEEVVEAGAGAMIDVDPVAAAAHDLGQDGYPGLEQQAKEKKDRRKRVKKSERMDA